jgi:hypothetical protein
MTIDPTSSHLMHRHLPVESWSLDWMLVDIGDLTQCEVFYRILRVEGIRPSTRVRVGVRYVFLKNAKSCFIRQLVDI